ncbi:hypothetical protein ILUMI_11156 [Ignelater luminosus]|uniref:Uncharacterized protein n=1 Tax=Ignelater luminosus TaxID=2038154 RepID=A0A8K0GE77_IGNLU|nr:hypothetical protein ILUMI_11156 [Ignelater luminosus]
MTDNLTFTSIPQNNIDRRHCPAKEYVIVVAMSLFTNEETAIIAIALDEDEDQRKVKQRKWVHEAWQKRETEGEFHTLYKKHLNDQRKLFLRDSSDELENFLKRQFLQVNYDERLLEEINRRTQESGETSRKILPSYQT